MRIVVLLVTSPVTVAMLLLMTSAFTPIKHEESLMILRGIRVCERGGQYVKILVK